MAEGEPPHRYALRQAREKFCRDGLIGLCHAVFATLLFVQSLGLALITYIRFSSVEVGLREQAMPSEGARNDSFCPVYEALETINITPFDSPWPPQ